VHPQNDVIINQDLEVLVFTPNPIRRNIHVVKLEIDEKIKHSVYSIYRVIMHVDTIFSLQ